MATVNPMSQAAAASSNFQWEWEMWLNLKLMSEESRPHPQSGFKTIFSSLDAKVKAGSLPTPTNGWKEHNEIEAPRNPDARVGGEVLHISGDGWDCLTDIPQPQLTADCTEVIIRDIVTARTVAKAGLILSQTGRITLSSSTIASRLLSIQTAECLSKEGGWFRECGEGEWSRRIR
jgi:hypothetical protein